MQAAAQLQEPETPTNIIHLQCVLRGSGGLFGDGEWFLSDMTTVTWTNKESIDTAKRFPLTSASNFSKTLSARFRENVRIEIVT